ncbi:MAG: hypothetical protein K2X03_14885 [Bryobacteraceae bacterium]|nr:hypothetical protein [Bryobacteraceae bacterium]
MEPQRPSEVSSNWDSAYYPLGSTREKAQAIEITGPGQQVKGLVIVPGPPITYRRLAIRVRFPDGKPMTTARVRITGNNWEEIVFYLPTQKQPWGQFPVPANRKIRVEVTDSWKRDLKREYAAEFDAGTTAIEKDFVIKP